MDPITIGTTGISIYNSIRSIFGGPTPEEYAQREAWQRALHSTLEPLIRDLYKSNPLEAANTIKWSKDNFGSRQTYIKFLEEFRGVIISKGLSYSLDFQNKFNQILSEAGLSKIGSTGQQTYSGTNLVNNGFEFPAGSNLLIYGGIIIAAVILFRSFK